MTRKYKKNYKRRKGTAEVEGSKSSKGCKGQIWLKYMVYLNENAFMRIVTSKMNNYGTGKVDQSLRALAALLPLGSMTITLMEGKNLMLSSGLQGYQVQKRVHRYKCRSITHV